MANTGVPSAMFLPAAEYKFEDVTGLVELTVPTRGQYPDDFSKKGSYDICPEEGVILFGTLLEVLFAHSTYPSMEGTQRFVISGLDINNGYINVVGRVVEFVEE